jgi:hypothetical protein
VGLWRFHFVSISGEIFLNEEHINYTKTPMEKILPWGGKNLTVHNIK